MMDVLTVLWAHGGSNKVGSRKVGCHQESDIEFESFWLSGGTGKTKVLVENSIAEAWKHEKGVLGVGGENKIICVIKMQSVAGLRIGHKAEWQVRLENSLNIDKSLM